MKKMFIAITILITAVLTACNNNCDLNDFYEAMELYPGLGGELHYITEDGTDKYLYFDQYFRLLDSKNYESLFRISIEGAFDGETKDNSWFFEQHGLGNVASVYVIQFIDEEGEQPKIRFPDEKELCRIFNKYLADEIEEPETTTTCVCG